MIRDRDCHHAPTPALVSVLKVTCPFTRRPSFITLLVPSSSRDEESESELDLLDPVLRLCAKISLARADEPPTTKNSHHSPDLYLLFPLNPNLHREPYKHRRPQTADRSRAAPYRTILDQTYRVLHSTAPTNPLDPRLLFHTVYSNPPLPNPSDRPAPRPSPLTTRYKPASSLPCVYQKSQISFHKKKKPRCNIPRLSTPT